MTDYTELIHRLRQTESRSKRKLLDEAAETIEKQRKRIAQQEFDLHRLLGCGVCKHNYGWGNCAKNNYERRTKPNGGRYCDEWEHDYEP